MKNTGTILLVEDDADDQLFFTEALSSIAPGISCTIAGDGLKALDLLNIMPVIPDLIFLDLNMPRMNGLEFLKLLKSDVNYTAVKHIPVIILTTSSSDAEKCLRLGASVYQVKPPTLNKLAEALLSILSSDIAPPL